MAGNGKSRRGFASMDPARQREIASKGGKAAHAKGTAHEWSSEEARVAGRRGGEVVSRDRAHMAAIGREGGEARGASARAARAARLAHERTQGDGQSARGMSDRERSLGTARDGRDQRERQNQPSRTGGERRIPDDMRGSEREQSRDGNVGLGSTPQPRGTDESRSPM